jgi:hypothetical protein
MSRNTYSLSLSLMEGIYEVSRWDGPSWPGVRTTASEEFRQDKLIRN